MSCPWSHRAQNITKGQTSFLPALQISWIPSLSLRLISFQFPCKHYLSLSVCLISGCLCKAATRKVFECSQLCLALAFQLLWEHLGSGQLCDVGVHLPCLLEVSWLARKAGEGGTTKWTGLPVSDKTKFNHDSQTQRSINSSEQTLKFSRRKT